MKLANLLAIALRGTSREWRSGELGVLAAALIIAVGAVTSVGFFTDRVESAMQGEAAQLLAGDLAVRSSTPTPPEVVAIATRLNLRTSRTVSFRSVVVHGDQLQLAEVKAVTDGYPLRGKLQTADDVFAPPRIVSTVPEKGTAWADARLLSLLGLRVGDSIELGSETLRIAAVLGFEPDRGGDLFSIAPRLMMNWLDVDSSGLIQPGSRVSYMFLVAGDKNDVGVFKDEVGRLGGAQLEIRGVRDARPEISTAIRRAEQFLGLAALVSVMLAGAAIAVACRRYANRHHDAAAVMRCFGASQSVVSRIFLLQILSVGLVACMLGCVLGFAAQWILVQVFEGLLVGSLPHASLVPAGVGILFGMVALLGFSLPPILRLSEVSPARVLRRELGTLPVSAWSTYLAAGASLVALTLWQARDLELTLYVLCGSAVTLIVAWLSAIVLVRCLGLLRKRVGVAWRFGVSNIARRPGASALQIVAFGLGLMMLMLLSIVRNDILDAWTKSLPPDAPNFFLINISPEQVDSLQEFMTGRGLQQARLYPMIRGRLASVNDQPLDPKKFEDERARRLATREFNLSWADTLKADNRLVAGRWWDSNGDPAQFSVEDGLAKTLGIILGDELSFTVGGSLITGRVTSLRFVEWDSFEVNFFVVSPRALLEGQPSTYISSFHLPSGESSTLVSLVKTFANVTVLDVDALLTTVRTIMDQAVTGIQFVFIFTVLAGMTVLIAAVHSTMDERRFETAIIRTLGASRSKLAQALTAEFVTLGLMSGLLASGGAAVVGMIVANQVFELAYSPGFELWLIGPLGGAAGVCVAGLLSARRALSQPPIDTLKQL